MTEVIVLIIIGILIYAIVKAVGTFKKKQKNKIPKSKLPATMLEELYDGAIESLLDGSLANQFESDLILKRGERIIFSLPNIQYCEERSVRIKGTSSGFSIRVAKGVTYRTGGFEASTEMQISLLDTGDLTLTNKRLVFNGPTKGQEIPLSKINTIEPITNGFRLGKSGKQRMEYYMGTEQLTINMDYKPDGEDKVKYPGIEPEVVRWKLTGSEFKELIQKTIQRG